MSERVLNGDRTAELWEAVKNYVGENGGSGGGGVPKGSIIIWSGSASDIPDGWALCDGQDGRPDLRDKFVLAAGLSHPVGQTGGRETVQLTVAHIPEHRHGIGTSTSGTGANAVIPLGSGRPSTWDFVQTAASGGSTPHENMPPFYALCYIIKAYDDPPWVPASISIQEYDAGNGWYVRKWSDGYVEQSKISSLSIPASGWKRYGETSAYTFEIDSDQPPVPLLRTSVTLVNILSITPSLFLFCGKNDEDRDLLCTFGAPGADRQVSILFTVSGRWK